MDRLMEDLWELYNALNAGEMLERYIWFSENGKDNCKYAAKSRELFYSEHYDKIKELIEKVKGESNGR